MPLELERPKLSAEEERLPYAKYFHKPLAPIPQEKLDIWNGPAADPAAALPFAARGRFQDADVPGLDNGTLEAINPVEENDSLWYDPDNAEMVLAPSKC